MDDEFDGEPEAPARCPEGCPNAGAPYCPAHEDPNIYKRDETKLHLAEAYAINAARDMVCKAIEHQRERRKLKELRVPLRMMDEFIVFAKKVVLDSGEHMAQGEIERKVAGWIDKSAEQDLAKLDRIKERYMRFTTGADGKPVQVEAKPSAATPATREVAKTLKRPSRKTSGYLGADSDYIDDEF